MTNTFLRDDYEACRKAEALNVRLDENASWDQVFERTAILVCRASLSANIQRLRSLKVKVNRHSSWSDVLKAWELIKLERIRKETMKRFKLPKNGTWEEMAMIKTEKHAKVSWFTRKLNQCRTKCPLTWEKREELRQKEAQSLGLPANTRWKTVIKEGTQKQFEESVNLSINYLGFSPDAGFAELYSFIVTHFADSNRSEEATFLGLKETASWDEIFEARALYELDIRRFNEATLMELPSEKMEWDDIIKKRYLIDLDLSRKEAIADLNLPENSSWNDIIKQDFMIIDPPTGGIKE